MSTKTINEDYYAQLGVSKNASTDEIRKAYRKLALQWHPDKNPNNREEAENKFKKLAEAYDCLSDPVKRQKYDAYGPSGRPMPAQHGFGRTEFRSQPSQSQFVFATFEDPFRDHVRFSFDNARRIFEEVFGTFDPFSVFEDDFMGGMFGSQNGRIGHSMNYPRSGFEGSLSNSFSLEPFNNMHSIAQAFQRNFNQMHSIPDGFGGNWSSSHTTSTTMMRNGDRNCVTTVTKTVTNPVTGRLETQTETTVRHPDGRIERSITGGPVNGFNHSDIATQHNSLTDSRSANNLRRAGTWVNSPSNTVFRRNL